MMKTSKRSTALQWPIAILDIGSNTIRLTVYRHGNTKKAIFNEKVACALGQDLEKTGRLNPAAKKAAKHAIAGFNQIAHALGCQFVHAVATSAMRDARDGAAFAAALNHELRISIQIISGAQEAHYSALGVISYIPDAEGIVADLGGGSLELAAIANGRVSDTITLPLGTLRLANHKRWLQQWIKQYLAAAPDHWAQGLPIYAVGGIARTIASVHSQMHDNSGKIKSYSVERAELLALRTNMLRLRPEQIVREYSVDPIRAQALPQACLLFAQIIQHLDASKLIITTRGLTDGYLFSLMKRRKV